MLEKLGEALIFSLVLVVFSFVFRLFFTIDFVFFIYFFCSGIACFCLNMIDEVIGDYLKINLVAIK